MDIKNLDAVLAEYIRRFDELHDFDKGNESYKWRATSHFKKYWDINASNFEEMFKLAMKETSNLIDNATVQPIGGILTLLKHEKEVEFVRECFRELYVDDDGDINARQERVDIFANRINNRLEKYVAGSWKYPQKINNVIYYLNLYKPEQNYIFKATEASAWADCIEFGDDFGSGSNFSLKKYYKMCDELRDKLINHPQIMYLYNQYICPNMIGFDDDLHILVYDVIYCAHYYNLYNGMEIQKVSKKQRIQNAKIRDEKNEIIAKIAELQKLIEDNQQETVLPDITGANVCHKQYGCGVVESVKHNVTVVFGDTKKIFQYPNAFLQGFLKANAEIMLKIAQAAKALENKNSIAKEKERLEQELKKLEEKYIT